MALLPAEHYQSQAWTKQRQNETLFTLQKMQKEQLTAFQTETTNHVLLKRAVGNTLLSVHGQLPLHAADPVRVPEKEKMSSSYLITFSACMLNNAQQILYDSMGLCGNDHLRKFFHPSMLRWMLGCLELNFVAFGPCFESAVSIPGNRREWSKIYGKAGPLGAPMIAKSPNEPHTSNVGRIQTSVTTAEFIETPAVES